MIEKIQYNILYVKIIEPMDKYKWINMIKIILFK